jgi:hypothetical protein
LVFVAHEAFDHLDHFGRSIHRRIVTGALDNLQLRVSKLSRFLNLRGVLADDAAFDQAMKQLDELWQSLILSPRDARPIFTTNSSDAIRISA